MWRFVLQENIHHLKVLIATLDNHSQLAGLRAELQEAEEELAELNRLSAQGDAAHNVTYSALLTGMLREEVKQQASNFGLIQLLEASTSALRIAAQVNFQVDFLRRFAIVHPGDGSVYGKALADGDPIWIEDVSEAELFAPYVEAALAAGFRAIKSLPLSRPTGSVFGILSLQYAQTQRWSEDDHLKDRHHAKGVAASIIAARPSL